MLEQVRNKKATEMKPNVIVDDNLDAHLLIDAEQTYQRESNYKQAEQEPKIATHTADDQFTEPNIENIVYNRSYSVNKKTLQKIMRAIEHNDQISAKRATLQRQQTNNNKKKV